MQQASLPVLELVGLRKSFGSLEILKGIDLEIRAGELVFIIGPSGSGKSTLLRCCNRIEEASAGAVIVDGEDITSADADLNRIRQKIGMVFQAFNLYPHLNALGNVSLALRRVQRLPRVEAERRASAALSKVGLTEKAMAYPSELSGGQQQRVAIARALALEPRILLFDEPTSALDPELVGSVLQVMRSLRQSGMTMVVVSHELRFARAAADRVVFMDHGAIVDQGPPARMFGPQSHARVRDFVATLTERH